MDNLKSDSLFQFIVDKVNADPGKAKSIGGHFMFIITKDGKTVKNWTLDLRNAKAHEGTSDKPPNTTLTVSDEDIVAISQGKLNPQTAIVSGRMKITGNIMLTQKLAPLVQVRSKL